MGDNGSGHLDWHEEYNPITDDLAGDTHAANFAHAVVRQAFMRHFWKDEKVQERVSYWGKESGTDARVIRAGQALECLKELAGLKHRGELLYLDGADLEVDETNILEAEEAVSAIEGLCWEEEDIERITHDSIAFVEELGLPYPWLALELVNGFIRAAVGCAFDIKWEVNYWYDPEAAWHRPVSPGKMELVDGESWLEAIERLSNILTGRGMPTPIPPGKTPSESQIAALERYAYWLYLYRVKKYSVSRIARDAYPDDIDRRKDVYTGLKRAEELLSLTPYTF